MARLSTVSQPMRHILNDSHLILFSVIVIWQIWPIARKGISSREVQDTIGTVTSYLFSA
ncbi:hypothetical protein RABR111495_05490 [Rahnella bruchi]